MKNKKSTTNHSEQARTTAGKPSRSKTKGPASKKTNKIETPKNNNINRRGLEVIVVEAVVEMYKLNKLEY